MFEFIEKELDKNYITYFKLTGSTKDDERIRMVDEVNERQDVKVFLIPLCIIALVLASLHLQSK